MASRNRTHISISRELKSRLERVAQQMLEAYESGQRTRITSLQEQGNRGVWVSPADVIAIALDELESHWERSKSS